MHGFNRSQVGPEILLQTGTLCQLLIEILDALFKLLILSLIRLPQFLQDLPAQKEGRIISLRRTVAGTRMLTEGWDKGAMRAVAVQ